MPAVRTSSSTPIKRQANLASFFTKPSPAKPPPSSTTPSKPTEIISIQDDSPEPPSKRRRVSSDSLSPTRNATASSSTIDQKALIADPDYPPPNHPSYHPPPSPSYNHPIVIAPIPQSLLDALSFNTVPKPIVKPDLGLDLLYFKRFIEPSCSAELTKYLLDSLPWYRVKYMVRGISINTPRYTTVFGKDATSTPWTGYDKAEPRAIPRILLKLMQMGTSPTHSLRCR